MTEFNILESVKIALGLQGNSYFDDTIQFYIDETKEYLKSAGCSAEQLALKSSAGVIARGVSDLWNNGSGNAELSPYFKERAAQLALSRPKVTEESDV